MKSKKRILIPLGIGVGTLVFYFLVRGAQAAQPLPQETQFIEEVAKHYYRHYYARELPPFEASQIASSLAKWTKERNLNLFSCLAIVSYESGFDRWATSPVECKGLWQLKDIAVRELERVYGIKGDLTRLYEIDYNNELGTMYYLYCVRRAEGERREAIARYYKTTEYWEAWAYADAVLGIREDIAGMYEDFITTEGAVLVR